MAEDDDLLGDWTDIAPKRKTSRSKSAAVPRHGVIDINELRATTERAIQEGKDKKAASDTDRVNTILQKATERAQKAAARGKNSCRVMKLQRERDFVFSSPGFRVGTLSLYLKGISKIVCDHFKSAQIQVDFEPDEGSRLNNLGHDAYTSYWLIMKW